MNLSIRPLDLCLYALILVVWGSNFAVVKLGLEQLPPILLIALRFLLVAAVLLPFVPRPPRRAWPALLTLGFLLGVLHFTFMFVGLEHTPAATAALLTHVQVPFAALLAAIFFKDHIGWRRALGIALALLGVMVVVRAPDLTGPLWATALILAAALIWAVTSIIVKRIDSDVSGTQVNAFVAAIAAPPLLAISLVIEEGHAQAIAEIDWLGIGVIAYNALAVVVFGYGLWYKLLARYGVNQSMPFTLLVLPVSMVAANLILGEPLTLDLLLGGLLVLAGISIIVVRRPQSAGPKVERL